MKRGFVFFVILISIFLIVFVSADNASSTSYTVDNFHLGSSEMTGSSASYTETSTGIYSQGSGSLTSTSFTGLYSWFSSSNGAAAAAAATTTTSSGTAGEAAGGTGGGGIGKISPIIVRDISNLQVVPDSFNLPIKTNSSNSVKLSLTNNGKKDMKISLNILGLNGIIELGRGEISLLPGETKIVDLTINSPSKPDIYTGKIVLISEGKKYEVPFTLDVNSELSLFDISLDLEDKYKVINEGGNIIGQITLTQAGLQEKTDVVVEYTIKDFDGNVHSRVSETIAILKEKTYNYEFKTSDLPEGDYVLGAQVIYSGGVASASHQFKITKPISQKTGLFIIFLEAVLVIAVITILIVIARRYKRNEKI